MLEPLSEQGNLDELLKKVQDGTLRSGTDETLAVQQAGESRRQLILCGPESVEPLCTIAEQSTDLHELMNLAIVLGALGEEKASPTIISILDKAASFHYRYSTLIEEVCFDALGLIGGTEAIAFVTRAAAQPVEGATGPYVPLCIVRALGVLQAPEAIEALGRCLEHLGNRVLHLDWYIPEYVEAFRKQGDVSLEMLATYLSARWVSTSRRQGAA